MNTPLTTTLKDIRANGPCRDGWKTLRKYMGKTKAEAKVDETPLTVLTVFESNGMEDALWVVAYCINPYICRLFAADCAECVLPVFEAERPNDDRPRKAIAVARDANATVAAREIAWNAAKAAAPREWRPVCWAAWNAAQTVSWDPAGGAARAARFGQKKRLIQYLTYGEAAKDMPWEYET